MFKISEIQIRIIVSLMDKELEFVSANIKNNDFNAPGIPFLSSEEVKTLEEYRLDLLQIKNGYQGILDEFDLANKKPYLTRIK